MEITCSANAESRQGDSRAASAARHDSPNLDAACGGIAMYRALLTRGFCVAEFADVEPLVRIDQQPGTIDAQLPIVLLAAAIE